MAYCKSRLERPTYIYNVSQVAISQSAQWRILFPVTVIPLFMKSQTILVHA